jgi:hypothetical protein
VAIVTSKWRRRSDGTQPQTPATKPRRETPELPARLIPPALPLDLYARPVRPRSGWRSLWRTVRRHFKADPRVRALSRADYRKAKLLLLGMYECRDFSTGLLDADLPRIAAASGFQKTAAHEGLRLLWGLGYFEIVPRRHWAADAQPPGWLGRGKWLQFTRAYELKLPTTPPRWPAYAPPPEDAEPEVEHPPEHHSASGIPSPSRPFPEFNSKKDDVEARPQPVDDVDKCPEPPQSQSDGAVDRRPVSLEVRAARVAELLMEESDRRNDNQWRHGRRDGPAKGG